MSGKNRRKRDLELAMEKAAVTYVKIAAAATPHVRRARRFMRAILRSLLQGAIRRRGLALSGLSRVAWWGALALAFEGTRQLLAFPGPTTDYQTVLHTFLMGLGLCALSVMAAPTRNLRVLGSAQGALHAGCAALALVALGA